MTGPLVLDDIADLRAYERERETFLRQVIAVKKLRRVSVGPVVTLTFESRTTVRFQVQEMARAERMISDRQIQHELDVYNRLLPAPGELSATLFLELVTGEELRRWLPRLVGIERSCGLVARRRPDAPPGALGARGGARGPADQARGHRCRPLRALPLRAGPGAAFADGPVSLVVDHPGYPEGRRGVALSDATRAELLRDLPTAEGAGG